MIYITSVMSIVIAMIFCSYKNSKISFTRNKNVILYFSFGVIILISALRNVNVGVDTKSYLQHFYLIANTSIIDIITTYKYLGFEIGYNLLCKSFSFIFPNYYVFQMFISFIYCYGMMKFIKNNTYNVYLCIILFLGLELFTYSLNISRQMLAVMILCHAWNYLIKDKFTKSVLLFFLALTFHATSVVFVLVYIVYKLRNKQYIFYTIPFFLVLFSFNYQLIIGIFKKYFPYYINYYVNERNIQSAGSIIIVWLIIGVLSIYIIYNKKNLIIKDKLYATFSLVYIFCNVVGLSFNYFERIGIYFLPFVLLLFDRYYVLIDTKKLKFLYFFGTATCFLVLFFITVLTSSQYQYSFFIT